MAENLAQYQDEQPILTHIPIASAAKGSEALAQSFGDIGKTAAQVSADMYQDQSSAMLVHANANIQQIQNDLHIGLIEHPGQATQLQDNAVNAIDSITQSAYVNKSDRLKLQSASQTALDNVELKTAQVKHQQSNLQGALAFYSSLPDSLQAYQTALIQDPDHAGDLKEGLSNTVQGLVMSGAITPHQASSTFNAMSGMVSQAARVHEVYGDQNATAQDYHTATSTPLNQGIQNAGAPINQNTKWLIDRNNQDQSLRGVLSDISNRELPDPQTFMNLSENDQSHAMLAIQGTKVADGMINAGMPYPQLLNHYKDLTSKGEILNYSDEATKNALGVHIEQLKNNYQAEIGKTPQGGAIIQDWNAKRDAIINSPLTNEQKNIQLTKNDNDRVSQLAAYGQALHIPSELIKPIDRNDINTIQGAFSKDANPAAIFNTLGKYSEGNKMWVANSLEDPDQRLIIQAITLGKTISPGDSMAMIAANQKGREADFLKISENKDVNDKALTGQVASALANQGRYLLAQHGNIDGATLQASMIKSAVNYVKYQAATRGDYSLNNSSDYIRGASNFYQQAFPTASGVNYIYNPNQLKLTEQQADVLFNYARAQGLDHLNESLGDRKFNAVGALGNNPLTATLSPTNDVIVQDGNGTVYYSVPYSTKYLAAAQAYHQSPEYIKQVVQQSKSSMTRGGYR